VPLSRGACCASGYGMSDARQDGDQYGAKGGKLTGNSPVG
jgi:hypothetical protein